MLSAGNDIVALSEIDVARTITKQFYSKILSEPEITLYERLSTTISLEHYVWLLWSVKESAYKFLKRLDPELIFTPVKFEVQQLEIPVGYLTVNFDRSETASSIISGLVRFGNYLLYSRSIIYKELISTVIDSNESFEGVYSNIKDIDSTDNATQSSEVRTFLIDKLSRLTGKSNLAIQKNDAGIPVLFEGEEELSILISLSHHGSYIGFSFKLNQ